KRVGVKKKAKKKSKPKPAKRRRAGPKRNIGAEIIEGLNEAIAFERGEAADVVFHPAQVNSDAEIRRQTTAARGRQRADRKAGRVVVAAHYDAAARRVVAEMSSGLVLSIPVRAIPELKKASARKLAEVAVDELGYGLHWSALDVDVS